jgi:Ca-activated chloride channel homolog
VLRDRKKETHPRRPSIQSAVVAVMLALILNGRAASGLDRYNQGDFDGALESFREELKHDPDSPRINFDLGDAAYRLQKYDEAFEAYSKAMVGSDPALQQKAYYNAGNTLFMEGNHAQDLEQQLSNYYDARYQYNQALDRNPGDEQAKKNLRLLEERIKDAEKEKEEKQLRQRTQQRQSQRQRNQRNRNKQQKNQMGQQRDQQSQPDSGKSQPDDQQSPGGDQQNPSDPNEGAEGDDQPQDESTPTPKKDGQAREITPSDEQKQQLPEIQESKPGMMSEEEALGLLNSLKDESDRIDLMHRKTDRGILRDW